jgi:hypothetical protein
MNIKARFDDEPKAKQPSHHSDAEPISAAARNLALAYKLDDLIDRGLVADYSAAARLLGVSQPRLTHLMSLRLLAPTIQEAIVLGTLSPPDKKLRALARLGSWDAQLSALAS